MAKSNQPTVVGRGLGGELRGLREAKKLALRRVAARLDWQASKLSRMENGIQGIRAEDVASLLVIYGVTGDERKRLLGLAERSAESGWWEVIGGLSDESRTLIRLETEATTVVNWEPLLIPGLLQTADYTQALMRDGGVEESDAQSRVAARLGRQAILTRPQPPELLAIMDEMVLRRVLGSHRLMARQLRHLIEAADRPNITLRVVPLAVGGHSGLDGGFALFDFPRNKSVVYLDHKISGLFLEEAPQVAFFRREAERLGAVALSPTESVDFVARVATEHERE
ncbi:helix-turn-helix domain-containing protein [Micromonospora sp. NBC_01796]|uniref:helix-turn-helix domain-containing protein n=1 Tax=Micromonospora sp. NBC_01796 TaxID=2975987 RepID=UPI002DDB0E1E|nr:helix-turn-helix transcriptional regulator [Micromonospora sp. NBC_01796]WSA89236.1 helix-turn-helix domain-containing protein [Micromonospora sp. NBC_01796]